MQAWLAIAAANRRPAVLGMLRTAVFLLTPSSACGRSGFDPTVDTQNDASGVPPPGAITVTFGEGGTATFGGVTLDTMVSRLQANQDDNYGRRDMLASSDAEVALLRFDVRAIPKTAEVFSARLQITSNDDQTSEPLGVYRMLEAWDEGTGDGAPGVASYNLRLPSTAWTSPGIGAGSRGTTPLGGFPPARPNTTYVSELAAETISDWVKEPSTNFGVALILVNGDMGLVSSDHPKLSSRPLLEVTYVP